MPSLQGRSSEETTMSSSARSIHKAVATITAVALLSTQLSPAAMATSISDVPLAVKNRALPNIIYVLDDSGSMNSEFLPALTPTNDGALWWKDSKRSFIGLNSNDADEANVLNYNKVGKAEGEWRKYVYLFPVGHGKTQGKRTYADDANDHFAVPPTAEFAWTRSSAYNSLYYNPAETYRPWEPSNDGTNLITFSNASATEARTHPVHGSTRVDLTVNIDKDAANWTFRMWPGMTAPGGAYYKEKGGTTWTKLNNATQVPNEKYWDVRISYFPATYYVPDPAGEYVGPDQKKLKRYEIKPGNTFPSNRSYENEIQNFANWFVYYRKRELMANASLGASLTSQTGIKGGMFTLNNRNDVTMYDFSNASDKLNGTALLHHFYNKTFEGGTPTREALDHAGKQFMRRNTGAPIEHECQFNIAFVITDGFASKKDSSLTAAPANYDGQTDYTDYPYNRQYSETGDTITHPYQDALNSTMADLAMQYYSTNLRSDLPAGKVPVDKYDQSPGADRNPNLHMNTYALGLGVKGTIFGTGSAAANNPYATAPVWPDPHAVERSPASVDELWHATLNGRGEMLSASDPAATKKAIDEVLNAVVGKVGAAAAVAVANPHITTGDNISYISSYNSGNWSGNLNAYRLNLNTGVPDTSNPVWVSSAQKQLNAKTASSRKIVTSSGAASAPGIQFQPASGETETKLSTAQQTLLNTSGSEDGASVLAFVRGSRSDEGTTYRTRTHVLGDIVNAEPVVLAKPSASYTDAGYTGYKTAKASRSRVIFQGANDGMLHVFDASGAEAWAYIPSFVIPNLNNLSRKRNFKHRYYVDGTPSVVDVDFVRTGGTSGDSDWHTLLVGGLGKGGNGYYALDVTNPTPAEDEDEADVATKVLWEFPNAGNKGTKVSNAGNAPTYGQVMGHSFGKPVIVKTAAKGWVVLLTSGYNNGTDTGGDGKGYLFVLNAKTGAVIKALSTGAGASGNPSGLAQISAYVENQDIDNTTDFVYAGDLFGNVWRFNLTGAVADDWSVTRLATLVDKDGNAQPVTTAPELAKFSINGSFKRMVYVGTGQYLGDSDIPGSTNANDASGQTQTMYGLVDDLDGTPLITPLRSSLQEQKLSEATTANGITSRTASTHTVNFNTQKGWYMDLSISGERVNTDPALANGVLFFTSNIPSTDPCKPGGKSWLTMLDFQTGAQVNDTEYKYASRYLGEALASRALLVRLPGTKAIIRKSDDTTDVIDAPRRPPSGVVRRISWRELPDH
jgi:type IV pilus assembly protein PilY1